MRRAKTLLWRSPRFPAFAVGVFFALLALTLLVSAVVHRSVAARDELRFRSAAETLQTRIERRLDSYTGMLLATRAAVSMKEGLTASDFRAYVAQLELEERYPGAQGVGFTLRVDPADRERVEQRLRDEGQVGFRIWPDAARGERHTIAYLEPHDRRNLAAIGFDMFSEPTRREAMLRARDTGEPAASGKVTLVQEIDAQKQSGFLIYVPVYRGGRTPAGLDERRRQLIGFVYSPFRMGDLLDAVLAGETHLHVGVEVFDRSGESGRLLYRSSDIEPEGASQLESRAEVAIAGRPWLVVFRPSADFDEPWEGRVAPLVFGVGALLSVIFFFVARARSRARDALRVPARVLESMSEGVSVWDRSGIIRYTNPAQERTFGYQPGELIGRHVGVLFARPSEDPAGRVNDVMSELRSNGGYTGEFSSVKKDGTKLVTLARITALELGGTPYWIAVLEDVTDAKRAVEERERLLVREQTAREQAEAASRAKDEFLAVLGHELRNPLAPISTALELMRLRGSNGRELDVIERQLRHVVRLVDDLLDVSRITRGKIALKRQRVQLASAVSNAVEIASPLLEQRRHRLELTVEDVVVEGDETRLAQVVANLLNNAAKYTEPGGHIGVKVSRERGQAVLSVKDDGMGIPPELLPRVFDVFTQGQRAVDRRQARLGLGLALVRSLVALHGGSVSAHSAGLGQGSEFVVRLPAVASEAGFDEHVDVEPTSIRSRRPRHVLIVDDNVEAAELLAEVISLAGHEVEVAYDGPHALVIASETKPEVAVLDIGLPVMDGYELAMRLRGRGTRLIAVTGYGQDHDRARALAAGFDHHFVKPVDAASLLAVIENGSASTGVEMGTAARA